MGTQRADVFRLAKQVTPRAAAERFGLRIGRGGNAVCPFHAERTGSLHFFPDGSARCFGACCRNFDAVDLTGRLLNVTPMAAAQLLIREFGLDPAQAPARRRPGELTDYQRRQQLARADLQEWCVWCDRLHAADKALHLFTPEDAEQFPQAFETCLRAVATAQEALDRLWAEQITIGGVEKNGS